MENLCGPEALGESMTNVARDTRSESFCDTKTIHMLEDCCQQISNNKHSWVPF